ncbi:hypothetical protein PF010_g24567 [Phytophthora fragariae]|uniref:Uncharacterized protein n=1 Tax=Phytophthora fragariae TaxID=53985 RepID=A0A6G0K283_9STRA|nr:hypothetical protein PF010_g24567 [Phytophthora fragariae]
MPPVLLQVVALVLRYRPSVTCSPVLGALISQFLGPSTNLSLREAASFGSTRLLDWVWDASCTSEASRTPGWSLHNYLRSEPYYHHYQFQEALQVVAKRGELEMLQWLFGHFQGLEVPSEAVTKAAENGHLPVLKYLLEHDQGRGVRHELKEVKVGSDGFADSVPVMPPDWRGPGNVVRWGGHAIRNAVLREHHDIARWLLDNTPHQLDERERNGILEAAVKGGNFELARSLLPLDRGVGEYVSRWMKIAVVEQLMETTDVLKKDQEFAAMMLWNAALEGNLDLVQRIAKLHERKKKKNDEWLERWEWGIGDACKRGDLPMNSHEALGVTSLMNTPTEVTH